VLDGGFAEGSASLIFLLSGSSESRTSSATVYIKSTNLALAIVAIAIRSLGKIINSAETPGASPECAKL
jgi:hypothetical protein